MDVQGKIRTTSIPCSTFCTCSSILKNDSHQSAFDFQYVIAMKAKLGIARDQFRELTRMLKAQEIDIENELSQREYQKTIIQEDVNVDC